MARTVSFSGDGMMSDHRPVRAAPTAACADAMPRIVGESTVRMADRRLLTRRRGALRGLPAAAPAPSSEARTGAYVSFVARPSHMSSRMVEATTASSTNSGASRRRTASTIWRKNKPPPNPSASTTAASTDGAAESSGFGPIGPYGRERRIGGIERDEACGFALAGAARSRCSLTSIALVAFAASARPHHVARSQQLVEHAGTIVAHAAGEHVRLPGRSRQEHAFELGDHLGESVDALESLLAQRPCSLQVDQEARERARAHRLHGAARFRQR